MADRGAGARLDAALVARALRDDGQRAFAELVRRHQSAVRAQLRRLTGGDYGWADDLAQETFLIAWRKLGQFRAEARFSTWLYRIAYTTFLQAARRRPARVEKTPEDSACVSDEPGAIALQRDLANAMTRLSEGERLALTLCYELDMSHEEAASVLAIPVGTVKTHIARAKAKLREWLAAWRNDYEAPNE